MERLSLVLVLVLLGVANGHICIIYPRQVGPMNISVPGSHDCYRRTPYCGGFTDGPVTTFPSGGSVEVTMQQNLNHFWPEKPGSLILLFSETMTPKSGDWTVLDNWDDWSANDMVMQMNFTRTVTFPDVECDPCLLGAQYVSYNQYEVDPSDNTDAIFYNCANIRLEKQENITTSSEIVVEKKEEKKEEPAPEAVHHCCTPSVWEAHGAGFGYSGQWKTRIVYDANLQRTRWDREGFVEPGAGYSRTSVITYYDIGPPYKEYLIDHQRQICRIYGADKFYHWCFGEERNMKMSKIIDFEDEKYWLWENPSNQFVFTAHQDTCLPRSVHHQSYSLMLNTYRTNFNASRMFDLPDFCAQAKFEDPCNKKLPEDQQ